MGPLISDTGKGLTKCFCVDSVEQSAAKSACNEQPSKHTQILQKIPEYDVKFRIHHGHWLTSVNGMTVESVVSEAARKLLRDTDYAKYDFDHLWKLIADFARFDFEWRVSSPSSWSIEDNKACRLIGPLDTHHTKNAAVTFNFNVEEVREMELIMELSGKGLDDGVNSVSSAPQDDGNSAFLGVLNDRTTDSFACIGKSGQITIRRTQENSSTHNYKAFAHGDKFGIRVRTPDIVQFSVNGEWTEPFSFSLGKLTTIYLSVRPIEIAAEVTELRMKVKNFTVGKLPFCLRNVWPEGFEEEELEEEEFSETEDMETEEIM